MNELDKEKIKKLKENSFSELANIDSVEKLAELRKKYLAKGAIISQYLKQINLLNEEEKKEIGQLINIWKKQLSQKIDQLEEQRVKFQQNQKLFSEKIDVGLAGRRLPQGYLHPITQLIKKITTFFSQLGYQIIESSEIETEKYNFTMLNMPPDHPARDMHDTFYFSTNLLLRTHTSGGQVRVMEKNSNQELKILIPGKVYRRDEDDATHTHQFTQIEALVIGRDISLSHLKGTLELFLQELFGKNYPLLFRPSYFPFTEPSCEVDIQCFRCQGNGCAICKQTGWVEVLGAGLVHPQVLKNGGFDSEIWSGFAFGCGVERLLMLKYGIEDIRNFYLNDVRFLRQFRW